MELRENLTYSRSIEASNLYTSWKTTCRWIKWTTQKFQKKPQSRGWVYCIEAREEEGEDPHVAVLGAFVMNTLPTKVLFNANVTHSFINPETAKWIACHLDEMDMQLCVTTLIGSRYRSKIIVWNCPIIEEKVFPADLISLGIQGYDVILGMD